jgi:hypothetical protein
MVYGLHQLTTMNYQEENNYPKAFLATGVILALMIALCYFIVFKNPPVQEDGSGGILVNYGTTDAGAGNDNFSTEQPSTAEKANKTKPDKPSEVKPTEQKPVVEKSNTKVVTQETEDAPTVAANTKKTTKTIVTEAAKSVKKPVVNQNALYKGPSNKGTGAGDGTTATPGNQGVKTGSPLASNYGDGGTGNGVKGTQWSFVSMPEVKNTSRTEGMVVVNVVIDANGNIISAEADRKTRMSDLDLIERCKTALRNSKLTSSSSGAGNQKGQVVFRFAVD